VINNILFAWQQRFYEHIIRDENELNTIREYVANNLINWADDEENLDYIKK
jgi:REP element-mobilizing transposase RayT